MGKLTRRELAAALSTSAVLLAQTPSPSPGAQLSESIAQNRELAGELDMFPLPMTAEPATIFKP